MAQLPEFELSNRLACWRTHHGFSLAKVAEAVAVSVSELQRLEAGLAEPAPGLRYRLNEMMRYDAAEQLELRKLVVSGFRSYVLLFDVDDTHLLAISSGLARLWPELSGLVNQSVLQHMSPEAKSLLQDPEFRGRIKGGEIVLASGASERATDANGLLWRRHRWTVTFNSYGTRIVGEVWYDPEPTELTIGVHEVRSFADVVAP